jgi:hypothetical protein
MHLRFIAVATLVAAHAVAIIGASHLPDRPAAVIAGSIYLPLMPFQVLGLPVFSAAESSAWASPSILGWTLLLVVWVGFWWAITAGFAHIFRSRGRSS